MELFNDRGRCLAGAVVTPDITPGVARLATQSCLVEAVRLETPAPPITAYMLPRGVAQ